MNRQAETSTIDLVVFLFSFALITLFAVYIYQQYAANVTAADFGSVAKGIIDGQVRLFTVLDYSYIFLVGGLLVSLFLSGYFLRTHPIFAIITLITGVFAGFVSVVLTNVFHAVKDELLVAADAIPITVQLASNFPLIVVVGTSLLMIGLYIKGGDTSTTGGYY